MSNHSYQCRSHHGMLYFSFHQYILFACLDPWPVSFSSISLLIVVLCLNIACIRPLYTKLCEHTNLNSLSLLLLLLLLLALFLLIVIFTDFRSVFFPLSRANLLQVLYLMQLPTHTCWNKLITNY